METENLLTHSRSDDNLSGCRSAGVGSINANVARTYHSRSRSRSRSRTVSIEESSSLSKAKTESFRCSANGYLVRVLRRKKLLSADKDIKTSIRDVRRPPLANLATCERRPGTSGDEQYASMLGRETTLAATSKFNCKQVSVLSSCFSSDFLTHFY